MSTRFFLFILIGIFYHVMYIYLYYSTISLTLMSDVDKTDRQAAISVKINQCRLHSHFWRFISLLSTFFIFIYSFSAPIIPNSPFYNLKFFFEQGRTSKMVPISGFFGERSYLPSQMRQQNVCYFKLLHTFNDNKARKSIVESAS